MLGHYQSAVVVTPHATNDNAYRALYVIGTSGDGSAGTVTVTPRQGASVVLPVGDGVVTHYRIETLLVTAASDATVIGVN